MTFFLPLSVYLLHSLSVKYGLKLCQFVLFGLVADSRGVLYKLVSRLLVSEALRLYAKRKKCLYWQMCQFSTVGLFFMCSPVEGELPSIVS